jgi:hypothetical protein
MEDFPVIVELALRLWQLWGMALFLILPLFLIAPAVWAFAAWRKL